jgi:indolepyruvate ferredoxin oxidoreductase beta subunit
MHPNKKINQFNMLIVGTGGQGQITLLQILAEAALSEGKEIKTSELHGLSQRGGSVEVHIRFGKEIYSPLIPQGKADLILGLEMQETLRAYSLASPKTTFLVNKKIIPIPLVKNLNEEEVLKNIRKISKNVILVPASEICQKELGKEVLAGIYLISLAAFKNLIPLRPNSILNALKKIIPEKYLEFNIKAFELAKSSQF